MPLSVLAAERLPTSPDGIARSERRSGQRSVPVFFLLLVVSTLPGWTSSLIAVDNEPRVDRHAVTGDLVITVPARQGHLYWRDVLRGLARAGGLDEEEAVAGWGEQGVLLEDRATRSLFAAGSAVLPDVKLRVVPEPDTGGAALRIILERGETVAKILRVKRWIRQQVGDPDEPFGLQWPPESPPLAAERPLVILLHGFNSSATRMQPLQTYLLERSYLTGIFRYPNDGPIRDSAAQFSRELQRVERQFPGRSIMIVAHSMGGLVAREALEDPALAPRQVKRLVQVCTPNQGTQWARVPVGMEPWEFWRDGHELSLASWKQSIADGLNEARSDLHPDSEFLRQLQARGPNPTVDYRLILGTGGPLEAEAADRWRLQILTALQTHRIGRLMAPKVQDFLSDFSEVQRGHGDGIVAVERGWLPTASEITLLPIPHNTLNSRQTDSHQRKLFAEIAGQIQ